MYSKPWNPPRLARLIRGRFILPLLLLALSPDLPFDASPSLWAADKNTSAARTIQNSIPKSAILGADTGLNSTTAGSGPARNSVAPAATQGPVSDRVNLNDSFTLAPAGQNVCNKLPANPSYAHNWAPQGSQGTADDGQVAGYLLGYNTMLGRSLDDMQGRIGQARCETVNGKEKLQRILTRLNHAN